MVHAIFCLMSEFYLHNTLGNKKERVFAQDGKTFQFYCCGPTVYGTAHIGNFRTFVLQDLMRRVAEVSGLKTKHVRNITDVDDKTIRVSQEEGKSLRDFTNFWRAQFEADCEKLNLLRPHVSPSAVEHMDEQIEMISTLVDKGLAYQGEDGSVYFRISAFEEYGKLSGICMHGMEHNADGRLNDSDEYSKESFNDFALWKTWKPEDGENFWESPWGKGRPGWHIECSAMCRKYLTDTFDLHSGGVDLTFPHHENEIAQSEGFSGKPFARHWYHIAHLRVEGEKMSKSLGNLYSLADIEEKGFTPEELRYVLLAGHYRQPLNFTFQGLSAARKGLDRLRKVYRGFGQPKPRPASITGIFLPVWDALRDDLNTSGALGQLYTMVAKIEAGEVTPSDQDKQDFASLLYAFGFHLQKEEVAVEVPVDILALAQERWEAKQNKDWATADKLRDALKEKGWQAKDGKDSFEVLPL